MQDENRIRNHRNRAGDADDGNEYENVKKGDDESIDDDGSEVGWNSDDEVAFHSTAMYRKSKSSRKQPESEEEPDEDDEDEDVDGGILLSDMLFKNLEKANKAAASSKSKASKGAKDESSDEESDEDESESEEDDDEDEEDDEEEEYGTGSESGSDVDDEDEDLDEVHSRLLSAIDRFAVPQSSSSSKEGDGRRYNNQNSAESAFSSALDSGDVSMNALLGALDDTRGLSVVKKHLADLEKGLAAPVHVEKVVADRMERSQVYDGSKTDMKKWHATVAANRHGGTLDLTHDKRQVRSFKSMVNRFVPTTDMEKEIQMVLVQHGATDQDTEQREVDELQGRNMSMQEIREKQAELAKVKALMFYDQMKRHRLNKIKSKAYRKIQKKKKLKNGATVADDVDEEEQDAAKEKDAYNRVKERMDMRHKNTSKWAKMALQYGHTDKSLRAAYNESVQLGHELSQKMNEELQDETRSAGSGSEDEQASDSEKQSGAATRRDVSNRASRAIQSLLSENLSSSSAQASSAVPEGRYKKLFEMDFMKRAAEQQKEKAREEAQSILREIEKMEEDYDSDLAGEEAVQEAKKGPQISKERMSEAKQEVKAMLGSGMAIHRGRKGALSIGGVSVGASSSASAPRTSLFEFAEDTAAVHSDEEEHAAMERALESNPWLQPVASVTGGKKRKATGTGAKAAMDKSEDAVYINTITTLDGVGKKGKASQKDGPSADANAKKQKKGDQKEPSSVVVETSTASSAQAGAGKEKPAVKISLSEGHTQADLVQMAFAGPDLEAEFHAFKKGEIDTEHGIDEKKTKILSEVKAGWGDWAGPGAGGMQISQKTLNKRDKLLTKVQNEHAAKVMGRSDAKMMNVMISNRRIKTASKYKITEIPHPFTSVEEYERSLQMPLGDEWNSSDVVKSNCQPDIKTRAGRVIEPIKLSKKRSSGANATQETRLNKPAKKAKK